MAKQTKTPKNPEMSNTGRERERTREREKKQEKERWYVCICFCFLLLAPRPPLMMRVNLGHSTQGGVPAASALSPVIGPAVVRLKLPPILHRIQPTFHVSRVKPFICNQLCPAPKPPPPPRVIDGSATFTVHQLLDVRRLGRGLQFFVDCPIVDSSLVGDFLKTHPVAPVKTPGSVRKRGILLVTVLFESCFSGNMCFLFTFLSCGGVMCFLFLF